MEIESFLSGIVASRAAPEATAKDTGNASEKSSEPADKPAPENDGADEGDPEDASDDATGAEESGSPAATKDAAQGKENAFLGERRRRQAAEKEAAALKAQIESIRQSQNGTPQKQDVPQKEPNFWDDPEGFAKRQRDEVRQETAMLRYEISEQTARSVHPDFDEFRDEFIKLAESNPVFVSQMQASKHPAEFAYQAGKRFRQARELGDVGDLDAWKEKERQKLWDEWEKEREEQRPLEAASKVPESLATKRGAGAVKREPYRPKTMEEVFDKSRYQRKR